MSAKLERISRMGGKTTFKDFRQGFSKSSLAHDSDMELKAALGMAIDKAKDGRLAIMALETKYAGTLLHEDSLRRAWDAQVTQGEAGRTPHNKSIMRFSISLALRQHAGRKLHSTEMTQYAYLLCMRRETLENTLRLCSAWLDSLTGDGERAFLEALGALRSRRLNLHPPTRPKPKAVRQVA